MTDTMLVTGGCGFIGSCFILQQMEQYPDIRLITFVPDRLGHDRRYAIDATGCPHRWAGVRRADLATG